MKQFFWITILSIQLGFSQNYLVEKLPSRVRLSGESIHMDGEPDMGFLGIGYEVFGLAQKFPNWYFGVNTYSALTGMRSGFFVFGVSTGIHKPLYKNKLFYDAGLFLGGGGGSAAPDGGGFMVRPHLDLEAKISKIMAIRLGITGVDFPDGGAITSLHANLGLTMDVDTYFSRNTNFKNDKTIQKPSGFYKLNASMLSTTLFNFSKGPLKTTGVNSADFPAISLIGFELNRFLTEHLYATVELGGAYKGGVDGFMMYLSGLGYELPFLKNYFVLDFRALIGGAGGGAVEFGGGLATQFEAGLGVHIKDYLLKVNLGKTYAPNGEFESNQVDISLGRTFKLYKNQSDLREGVVAEEDVTLEEFNFSTYNRAYVSGSKRDKSGRLYDKVFNLIGFEVEKKFNQNLGLVAATVWAYQGNYGAYAEGWLGMQYYIPLHKTWSLSTKGMIGAGGGGDINLGNGLAFQYGLGIEKKVNKRCGIFLNVGQVRPVQNGNFTPVLVDLGLKLNINQLVKN
ncbi:hypothetical protein Q4595_09785 [Wenyingzhuangia sp. 1_MG-2023]|nr:hypothetical protein [Wenyingzhuangia sp. 1_MG-2023]